MLLVVLLLCFFFLLWRYAIKKCKQGQFYSDTPSLWLFGIFVWGDGLVLLPFWFVLLLSWLLTAIFWQELSAGIILAGYLIFVTVRSGYEVMYWLNHQAQNKTYQPPLFRHISWLGAHEAAILYQLMNTVQMTLALLGLWLLA